MMGEQFASQRASNSERVSILALLLFKAFWLNTSFQPPFQVSLGRPSWNQWVPAGLFLLWLPHCIRHTEVDQLMQFYQANGPQEDCATLCLWDGPQILKSLLSQACLRVEQGTLYWRVIEMCCLEHRYGEHTSGRSRYFCQFVFFPSLGWIRQHHWVIHTSGREDIH